MRRKEDVSVLDFINRENAYITFNEMQHYK